jgi:hypothetical protein
MKLFDRSIYNIVLIHTARGWERIRVTRPHQAMPLDNIESTEAIEEIATRIINSELLQKFLLTMDGSVWEDECSDTHIERLAYDIIYKDYL